MRRTLVHKNDRGQLCCLFGELQNLRLREGQNLVVDSRGFAARSEQFSELALALAASRIDALVCGGELAIRAAQQVTQSIPSSASQMICFERGWLAPSESPVATRPV
jgi:hypothetical protein